jgi:TnpA family transposase
VPTCPTTRSNASPPKVGVSAADLGFYDFTGRQIKNHRAEIRRHTGFRPASVADADKLAAWLADGFALGDQRPDRVRAALLAHCAELRVEPPTPERVSRIVDSAVNTAEATLFARVHGRLESVHITGLENLARRQDQPAATATGDDGEAADSLVVPDSDTDVDTEALALIKSDPGKVSLATMLTEIDKLELARSLRLPATLFADVDPRVVSIWRARGAVESPSHLARHDPAIRRTYLAALVHQRQREITDTLVDLLNATIHKINARADKKVTAAFVAEHKSTRTRSAAADLAAVTEVCLRRPKDAVDQVVYPVLGGREAMAERLGDYKARTGGYGRDKRRVFTSSYSGYYRRGLIRLLRTLVFRSSNTVHQPILDGLGLILRYEKATTTFYPLGATVVVDGVVKEEWREFVEVTDSKGRDRINRHVYECCVLIALRERIRCKEIWVEGADRWRNPDEDLPADFDAKRADNYAALGLPLDAHTFITGMKDLLRAELGALNTAVPKLDWVAVGERNLGGPIRLSPLDPVVEPRNLRRLKRAITARWGTVPLIDMLTEAALRTGMPRALTSVGTREATDAAELFERLLLIIYGYGTNSGLRTVAAGTHPYSEEDLRYTARRYLTPPGLKAAGVQIANATFAARQQAIWGEGTTTVASDSTHFGAYDRDILTEWHSRYGGRGILVYWSIESGAMAIHSQLIACSASEVAAMIEGVMRHGTAMKVAGNYVDSHGQSEIGFGVTRLLGFDLLPRIKQINRVKLYRPEPGDRDNYRNLDAALTRPIRWDLIANNYDMLVKYATAIRTGTATTEAILRRFTRNASHPVYQAMLEVGRAQKTIFVCRYLRDRALQREINAGLNVVEGWNGVNDVIYFGKSGEFASNRRDQQELSLLCLHLLQAALVFVNTLMIQDILAEPEWADLLTAEDRRGLTPLFTSNMTPYGEVKLNMNRRLALSHPDATPQSATGDPI